LALSVWLLTGTHANGQAPTTPATPTVSAKATIQAAQKRLSALGYQAGAADGVMGAKAVVALKQFQADRSIPVTGQLDRKTIDALNAASLEAEDSGQTWTDRATGLMWTRVDNGSDVSWREARDYCGNLQEGGHSDWRLPTFDEFKGIYDSKVDAQGQWGGSVLIGTDPEKVTMHVKGNLYSTGAEWTSTPGDAAGEMLDFNLHIGRGDSTKINQGFFTNFRVLCVRSSGLKPR
jgi:hypothetical protein